MRKLSLPEIAESRLRPEAALEAERFPIIALLDDIRSLHNVGAMFRTADAVRLQEMILCGFTGTPPRKEIDKTALGASESVPWRYEKSAGEAVAQLKKRGVRIIALEHTAESRPHWDQKVEFPACLVVGNEVFGVNEEVLALADEAIEIPMFGVKHSLNVSVAFGIAIYELMRQYEASNFAKK